MTLEQAYKLHDNFNYDITVKNDTIYIQLST